MSNLTRGDVDIVLFRRSRGNGGQHNNKTATAVRMTHRATGIRVEACGERSQKSNLKAAYSLLEAKLAEDSRRKIEKKKKGAYDAKPDASFGQKIRTYHACERIVTDHRSGDKADFDSVVKRGKIDQLILSNLAVKSI